MNQEEIREVLHNEYINRPLEDERFSFEDWMKVTKLRTERHIKETSDNGKDYISIPDKIKNKDRVSFIDPDDIKRIGYVQHISKHRTPIYEIMCNGRIYDVEEGSIGFTKKEPNPDLSHVQSAPVLENMKTERILDLFRMTQYSGYHSCGVYVGRSWVVPIQLKKELNSRGHIERKQEKNINRKKNNNG